MSDEFASPSLKLESGRNRPKQRTLWGDALRRLIANRLSMISLFIVILLFLIALLGPYMTVYDYLEQDLLNTFQPPSAQHWLGTDDLGRDIFSRILYGARTATVVAFTVAGISLLIGILVGALAGYLGGIVDSLITWIIDTVMSVPGILLAMLVNNSLKYPLVSWMDDMYLRTHNPIFRQTVWLDFVLVFGALAFISWPGYARLIRGQILSIRHREYVTAARAIGSPSRYILLRHVIPNALGPVIVAVTQGLGGAMILESSLSFLGIGVQPPQPSWGNMLSSSLRLWQSYPHLLVGPAVTLGIMTVAFNLLGDGLNDALNPRQL